ncbi:MAG: OmpA family protein [Longimicrobiales bacterium]|nr:OmpA family protein [Longimicrobiales bacterium]
MILRRFVAPVLAATLLVAACKKEPPPPPAPPAINEDSIVRARADSIATVRAAAEATARTRAEAEARTTRERAAAAARATLEELVFFDYDKSDIRDDAAAVLRRKADVLRASPQVQLRVEGHADDRGSTEYNLALGNRRAESVRQFLVGFGLPESRFSIISYGEERPLENASNESAWGRNRRAQFEITAGANAINPPS